MAYLYLRRALLPSTVGDGVGFPVFASLRSDLLVGGGVEGGFFPTFGDFTAFFPPPIPFGGVSPFGDFSLFAALPTLSVFIDFSTFTDFTDLGVLDPFADFRTLRFDSLSTEDCAKTVRVTNTIELRRSFIFKGIIFYDQRNWFLHPGFNLYANLSNIDLK